MKTENRHINFQEPEGMMLLRYIKDTASNEEKSYIEAWLEACLLYTSDAADE